MKNQSELNGEFRVIGYYAGWNGDVLEKVDYSILTHLIYAFAIPTKEGHLRPIDHPELVRTLVKHAHDNQRKISLAVGGWSYLDIPLEATFVEATNSSDKIKNLGNEIVNMCIEYGFDGIDMDWEHPRYKSGTYKQYEALMLYLSQELHERGKILTSAVLSGVTWDGDVYEDSASQTEAVLNAIDWLNVMTYDGGEREKHSTYEFAVQCMKYWIENRGMKKEKVVMGLPFYSYVPPRTYETILEYDQEGHKKDMIIMDGQEIHYNGIQTIQQKTAYAIENCGGVMIWEITEDTTEKEKSLLKAIGKML